MSIQVISGEAAVRRFPIQDWRVVPSDWEAPLVENPETYNANHKDGGGGGVNVIFLRLFG